MARAPDNYRLLGLGCGVVAFLMTCTTGHPFLTPEVVFPFWLVAGLMVALSAPTATRESAVVPTTSLPAMAACAIALAVSVPVRAREAPPGPRHGLAVEGLFDWEMGEDGRRYRWSEGYASVFVGREARRVEIPVRAPTRGKRYCHGGGCLRRRQPCRRSPVGTTGRASPSICRTRRQLCRRAGSTSDRAERAIAGGRAHRRTAIRHRRWSNPERSSQ